MIPWEQIESDESYSSLSGQEKLKVKKGWFKEHIEPSEDFQALQSNDKITVLNNFFHQETTQGIAPQDAGSEPGYAKTFAQGVARGTEGLMGGVGSVMRWAGDVTGSEGLSNQGEMVSDFWEKEAQEGWEAPHPETFSGSFTENPSLKRAVGIVGEAAPSMGVGMGASGIGLRILGLSVKGSAALGGTVLGGLEGAGDYENARDAGEDIGHSSTVGLASGAGTAILEAIPLGRMLSFKGGRIVGALKGGAEEGAQEVTQTVWQNIVAKLGYDDSRGLAEGVIESLIGGMGTGGPMGAVTAKRQHFEKKANSAGVTPEEYNAAADELKEQVQTVIKKDTIDSLSQMVDAGEMTVDELASIAGTHQAAAMGATDDLNRLIIQKQGAKLKNPELIRQEALNVVPSPIPDRSVSSDMNFFRDPQNVKPTKRDPLRVEPSQPKDTSVPPNMDFSHNVQQIEPSQPVPKERATGLKGYVATEGIQGAEQDIDLPQDIDVEPLRPEISNDVNPEDVVWDNSMVEEKPVSSAEVMENIETSANEAATSPKNNLPQPTEKQIEAGNYKKGHVKVQGLDIAIENPDGSTRSGTSPDGKKWETKMQGHYGYFKRSEGKDGDQVDVFIGNKPHKKNKVYIVDQVDPETGKFDEHKVVMSVDSIDSAKELYLSNYEKGWKGLGNISEMQLKEFKRWVRNGKKTKPVQQEEAQKATPANTQKAETLDIGDKVKFIPSDDFAMEIEGYIQESVNNGDGYNILSPTKEDPYRTFRVWKKNGQFELLEKYQKGQSIEAEGLPESQKKEYSNAPSTSTGDGNLEGDAGNFEKTDSDVTFEEFEKAYRNAFNQSNKYTPDQAGFKDWTERMADMYDAHPDWADKIESTKQPKSQKPEKDTPKPTKKENAFKAWNDYISSLTDDQKEYVSDLIEERPKYPSEQLLKVKKKLKGMPKKPSVKKIGYSSKSVRDNTQRAEIQNSTIKIINKSGRKTVKTIEFSITEWQQLETSFGNPNYNKREYLKSLDTVVVDNTPESDSLKERIIDSQISAVNKALARYQSEEDSYSTKIDTTQDKTNENKTGTVDNKVEKPTIQDKTDKTTSYGNSNKVFKKDAADKARELLKKKLNQLNSGLDPEIVQAGIQLAGYHIEAGARSFVDYSKTMVSDLGDIVKPYLRGWYEAVRYYPGFENEGMTSPENIETLTKLEENNIIDETEEVDHVTDISGKNQGDEPGGSDNTGTKGVDDENNDLSAKENEALLLYVKDKGYSSFDIEEVKNPKTGNMVWVVNVVVDGEKVKVAQSRQKSEITDRVRGWLNQPHKKSQKSYEKYPSWIALVSDSDAVEKAGKYNEDQKQMSSQHSREQYYRQKYIKNPTEKIAKLWEDARKPELAKQSTAPTKKAQSLKKYTDYIESLTAEEKENASDLIVANPARPSSQMGKVKRFLDKVEAYQEKKQNRIDRMQDRADKAEQRSNNAYKRSDLSESASGIPLGQPILAGHHSEGRHRAALKRADNAMRKSVEESKKAEYYQNKAEAAENNHAISSDDPLAVKKLKEKIQGLEDYQQQMKDINKIVRSKPKNEKTPEKIEKLKKLFPKSDISKVEKIFEPDYSGRIGIPSYSLTNNNANIKRNKQRLAKLQRKANDETTEIEHNGIKIIDNVDENRLQIFFDGKPDADVRKQLKSSGFRWARSIGAWQRHRSYHAMRLAKDIVGVKEETVDSKPTINEPTVKPQEEQKPDKQTIKQQKAIAKLRAVAERTKEKAEEKYNQDRNTNTARRARMAASSMGDAAKDIAIAETMLKIADGIESGELKYLSKVKAKSQVAMLISDLNQAKYKGLREKYNSYAEEQRHYDEPATQEDVKHSKFPVIRLDSSHVASLRNDLRGHRGGKKIADEVYSGGSLSTDLAKQIVDFAKKKKIHLPWTIESDLKEIQTYERLGIKNTTDLHNMLSELVGLRSETRKEDPIKAKERELIGNKGVGIDFFPTPKPLAERLVDEADIQDGMKVLEPSAGKGDIADAVKDAGYEVDTVEQSPTLREFLELKKHNIVGRDFLEFNGKYDRIIMNPPFSKGMDIDHVKHAYEILNHGGRIVAIMGEHPFFANDKKSKEFREWLGEQDSWNEQLTDAFKGKEAFRQTGVVSRIVIIGKPVLDLTSPGSGTSKIAARKPVGISEAVKTFRDTSDAVKWIAGNSKNEFYREIASQISPFISDKVKLSVIESGVKVEGGIPSALNIAKGVHLSSKKDGETIYLKGESFKENGINEETILHEAIHAATAQRIKDGNLVKNNGTGLSEAVSDLYDLQNYIVSELKKKIEAGTATDFEKSRKTAYNVSSVDELIANGLSSHEFQDMLRGIKYNQKKTGWDKFVDTLSRILGLKGNTALDEVIRNTGAILSAEEKENASELIVDNPSRPSSQLGKVKKKLEKIAKQRKVRDKRNAEKKSKIRTLRGRIKQFGGINFGNFKGELKSLPTAVKFLSKKTGTPLDIVEQNLKSEGWLHENESLLDLLRDEPGILKRDRIGSDFVKPENELTPDEKKLKEDMEFEPEEPPKGEYVFKNAEDLPEGKSLTIIDGKGATGWDEYVVTEKDPFEVTLQDGVTVTLKPHDRVQVRKKDLRGKDYFKGDAIEYTSVVTKENLREFVYLEGHKKGEKGYHPLQGEIDSRREQNTKDRKEQQEQFGRLHKPATKEQNLFQEPKPNLFDAPEKISHQQKRKKRKEKKTSHLEQQPLFGTKQRGLFPTSPGSGTSKIAARKVDEAVTNIKSALKSERGSFSFENSDSQIGKDLMTVAKHIIQQGHDKFRAFRKELRRQLKEVWGKISKHVKALFDSAKSVIDNESGEVVIDPGKTVDEYSAESIKDLINENPSKAEKIEKEEKHFDNKFVDYAKDALDIVKDIHKGYPKGKQDTTLLGRIFRTPEFWKVPTLKRLFASALKRPDNYQHNFNEIINSPDGESYVEKIKVLSKQDKEQYGKLKKYIVKADRNKIGLRYDVVENSGVFDLYKAGKVGKDNPIEEFQTEREAHEAAIKMTAWTLVEQGVFNEQGADAWSAYRLIMDNGLENLQSDMKATIEKYEESGLPLPEIAISVDGERVEVDLKIALAKMGEMKGSYAPRLRTSGKHKLIATKNGENPRMEFSDSKTLISARKIKLEKQGYKVKKDFSNKMPEDVFEIAGNTIGTQALINSALSKVGGSEGIKNLKDIGIKTEWREFAGKNKSFIVAVDRPKIEYTQVLEALGFKGHARGMMGHSFRLEWELKNAPANIEEKLTDKIFQTAGITPDTDVIFATALATQVANIIKGRGFRSSMISRDEKIGKDVWVGYEEDPLLNSVKYARGIAAGIAKKQMAIEMTQVMTGTDVSWDDFKEGHENQIKITQLQQEIKELTGKKNKNEQDRKREELADLRQSFYQEYLDLVGDRKLDPEKQQNAFREGKVYMEDMLRNDEYLDRVMGTIKGLAVLKYLGGRVSAPLVNLTALVTSVPAAMKGYADIPLRSSMKYIGSASNMYREYRFGDKGKVRADMVKVFEEIEDNGWHSAQYNKEALSVLQSKLGRGWSELTEWSMKLFGATEQLNRVATIAGTYKAIKDRHKGRWTKEDHDSTISLSKKVSDRAHGTYGKETYPHWARGKDIGAQIAKAYYVFRKFSHNYIQTMYDLGFNKKQTKAALYMAVSPAIIAGVGASILTPIITAIFKMLGEDDPEEGMYNWLEQNFGETSSNFARFGVAGMGGHGISLKGSLAIGIGDLPTTIADVLGAPGSVITDIYEGGQNLFKGNLSKGSEKILPLVLGAPLKAIRESTEGITTRTNAPVFYGNEQLKTDGVDAFLRAFSFNPARIAGIREKQWNEKKRTFQYSDDRKDIYARLRKFFLLPVRQRAKSKYADILREITEYNERVRQKGLSGKVPFITSKSIKTNLKRSFRPSKVERSRQ